MYLLNLIFNSKLNVKYVNQCTEISIVHIYTLLGPWPRFSTIPLPIPVQYEPVYRCRYEWSQSLQLLSQLVLHNWITPASLLLLKVFWTLSQNSAKAFLSFLLNWMWDFPFPSPKLVVTKQSKYCSYSLQPCQGVFTHGIRIPYWQSLAYHIHLSSSSTPTPVYHYQDLLSGMHSWFSLLHINYVFRFFWWIIPFFSSPIFAKFTLVIEPKFS